MSQSSRNVCIALALVLVTACGGGSSDSSSGDVSGLEAPSQIQVITVEGAQSLPSGLQAPQGQPLGFPAGSHYLTDLARNHVYDPSIEQIGTVNMILCLLSQTGAAEMVNQGPYHASINEDRCESGSDPTASSTGQSSGVALALALWAIDSSRADNASPQFVNCWLPEDGHDGLIRVRVKLNSSPSLVNPFGDFALNFAITPTQGGDINNPMAYGTLETVSANGAALGYGFFESRGDITQVMTQGDDGAETVAVLVAMSDDRTTGQARLMRSSRYYDWDLGADSGIQSEEYLIDFDEDEVLRELVGGDTACLSRTDFHYNTYRYNLYDAVTGARVELNSGFQIRTQSGGWGWLGYHGLWTSPGDTVDNGDVVERVTYGSSAVEQYTIVKAPGKLIQHERNTLSLAAAEGIAFEWHDFQAQPQVRYRLNVVSGLWYKTAQWSDANQTWHAIETPEFLDTAPLGFLGMYSQTLGGPCGYSHGAGSLTYFRTFVVNGASTLFDTTIGGVLDLYGYTQCLASGITGADAEQGQVFLPDQVSVNTPYHFEFHESDLTLRHDANGDGSSLTRVGLADGEAPTSGPFMWGMHSGPLVLDTAGLSSVWDVWNQDVFWVYETGANPWNALITAVDAQSTPVVFDPPLQFSYQHSTANDKNSDAAFNGFTCMLSYNGPGQLHGIPHNGVDFNGDGNADRYFPAFSIADGVLCGPTGDEYVLRPIESELTLTVVNGGCGTLDTASAAALPLPNGSTYVTPDIGSRPVITDPPAVIEGKVQ